MTPETQPGRSILVIENDKGLRDALLHLLGMKGYQTHTVANGEEALAFLRTRPPPDLILLDRDLPRFPGGDFRHLQAQDPRLASIPILVLTNSPGPKVKLDNLGAVPCLPKPVEPEKLYAAIEQIPPPRKPEILVVEDEPSVLRMLGVALRHFGFTVREASGGKEAVALFQQHHAAIAVVLLDVQMPAPDGPQTMALLRRIDPHVPIVFMSGNTGNYSAEELLTLGAARVLPKPFSSLSDLTRILEMAARPGPELPE